MLIHLTSSNFVKINCCRVPNVGGQVLNVYSAGGEQINNKWVGFVIEDKRTPRVGEGFTAGRKTKVTIFLFTNHIDLLYVPS